VAVVVVVVVAVVVLGGGGGDDPSSPPADVAASLPAGNLTHNPSFEAALNGWEAFQGRIAREPADDAPDGAYVARVTADEDGDQYTIDDEPDTLEDGSEAGKTYTATAWVKAGEGTDGKPVCLGLRDLDGGTAVAKVTAGGDWQRLQVSLTSTGGPLSVYAFRWDDDVDHDESFLVDAIALEETPGRVGDALVDDARCEA
jgi:hypothetical protein